MNQQALRRIPLHKLIDLKVDFAFKQLFGSERNKHITIVFLNAILARTGRDTIKERLYAPCDSRSWGSAQASSPRAVAGS
ncbi:PD-(D/E)XK nuclease family transposase [Caryophanon latum]|uniref:Uncharacterized protein n=1 Tax=Caryophanon latum TaxID=33977 RepID=A0A1C0YVA9_9BACL|nr:PD-(D/E)XK nuclease family transposase [Caryophanon latum]OCS91091.1 hypothetical protein A6K76_10120 [Caryophanon latum]